MIFCITFKEDEVLHFQLLKKKKNLLKHNSYIIYTIFQFLSKNNNIKTCDYFHYIFIFLTIFLCYNF